MKSNSSSWLASVAFFACTFLKCVIRVAFVLWVMFSSQKGHFLDILPEEDLCFRLEDAMEQDLLGLARLIIFLPFKDT